MADRGKKACEAWKMAIMAKEQSKILNPHRRSLYAHCQARSYLEAKSAACCEFVSLRGVLQLISEPIGVGDGRRHSRKKDGSAALKDAWLSSSTKSQDEFLGFADLRRSPIVIDGDGIELGKRSPFRLYDSAEQVQSDNWGTPANIIKLVKDVLRYIELDPASSDIDQKIVRAKRYFTEKDNGLGQDWWAETLSMNCPYSNPLPWITKAIHEHSSGRGKKMIILVHSDTSTKWFDAAWQACSAICFSRGRIKFRHPIRTKTTAAPVGSLFFYFGSNPTKFVRIFSEIGNAAINTWATKEAKLLKLRAVA
jgi:phage N-6-adenine-methyltransferase